MGRTAYLPRLLIYHKDQPFFDRYTVRPGSITASARIHWLWQRPFLRCTVPRWHLGTAEFFKSFRFEGQTNGFVRPCFLEEVDEFLVRLVEMINGCFCSWISIFKSKLLSGDLISKLKMINDKQFQVHDTKPIEQILKKILHILFKTS